jgi:hypothetical protein
MSQKNSPSFTERPPLDPLQRYTVPEANALLRQSNARTYQQIKAGELHVIRDGSRVYVPGSEIVRRSTLPGVQTPNAA